MDAAGSALLSANTHLFRVGRRKRGRKTGLLQNLRRTYPLTLIFENDSIAVPGRGLPIQVAGRKVVKISMFFI